MPETYTVNLFEFIQPFRHIPKDEAEKLFYIVYVSKHNMTTVK